MQALGKQHDVDAAMHDRHPESSTLAESLLHRPSVACSEIRHGAVVVGMRHLSEHRLAYGQRADSSRKFTCPHLQGRHRQLVRILVFRGLVRYEGRISAELGLGDRVCIVKDDGAIVIHADHGVVAKNWMPPGSSWSQPSPDRIVVEHQARNERLEIFLDQVFSDTTHVCTYSGPLVKLGSERELVDRLETRLELFGRGLRLVGREYRTPAGPIDLLLRGPRQRLLVVEVKRTRVTNLETLYQLKRYVDALMLMPDWQAVAVRPCLAAPGFSQQISAQATRDDVQLVRLDVAALLAG